MPTFTDADRRAVVEQLIEDFRWARSDDKVPEHRTYNVLKEIALELRGRDAQVRTTARAVLEDRIQRVRQSRTALGFDRGRMIALAQEVLRLTPTILQALEKYEGETQ